MERHLWLDKQRWHTLGLLLMALCVYQPGLAAQKNPLDVQRVTLDVCDTRLADAVAALSDQLRLPVSIEGRFPESKAWHISLHVKNATGRHTLDEIAHATGKHVWLERTQLGIINVVPKGLLSDPDWTLNLKCPEVKLENLSLDEAAALISKAAGVEGQRIGFGYAGSFSSPGGEKLEDNWLYKFYHQRVTTTIKAGTLRDALNQIAVAMGDAYWTYSERDEDEGQWKIVSFQPLTPVLDMLRVRLDLPDATLADAVAALSDHIRLPISIEGRFPEVKPVRLILTIKDMTARQTLDHMVNWTRKHVWREQKQPHIINIIPKDLADDPNWTLSRRCPELKLENASLDEAVTLASEAAGFKGKDRISTSWAVSIPIPGDQTLEDDWLHKFQHRRVTATIKAGTLRDALNEIAAATGDARWSYSERQDKEGRWKIVSFQPIIPNVMSATDASCSTPK